MKKTMKTVLSLALVLVLALSLVACGGTAPSGKYKFKSMTMEGQTVTAKDLGIEDEDGMYVEFKDDGTGKLSIAGDDSPFEWKGNVITAEGEKIDFTVKGSQVILKEDGGEMVFEK